MLQTPDKNFCKNCKKTDRVKSVNKLVYPVSGTAYCTFECYDKAYQEFVQSVQSITKK